MRKIGSYGQKNVRDPDGRFQPMTGMLSLPPTRVWMGDRSGIDRVLLLVFDDPQLSSWIPSQNRTRMRFWIRPGTGRGPSRLPSPCVNMILQPLELSLTKTHLLRSQMAFWSSELNRAEGFVKNQPGQYADVSMGRSREYRLSKYVVLGGKFYSSLALPKTAVDPSFDSSAYRVR